MVRLALNCNALPTSSSARDSPPECCGKFGCVACQGQGVCKRWPGCVEVVKTWIFERASIFCVYFATRWFEAFAWFDPGANCPLKNRSIACFSLDYRGGDLVPTRRKCKTYWSSGTIWPKFRRFFPFPFFSFEGCIFANSSKTDRVFLRLLACSRMMLLLCGWWWWWLCEWVGGVGLVGWGLLTFFVVCTRKGCYSVDANGRCCLNMRRMFFCGCWGFRGRGVWLTFVGGWVFFKLRKVVHCCGRGCWGFFSSFSLRVTIVACSLWGSWTVEEKLFCFSACSFGKVVRFKNHPLLCPFFQVDPLYLDACVSLFASRSDTDPVVKKRESPSS